MSREIKFRAWDKIQKEMLFSSTGEYPDFRSDTQHIKIVHDGVLFADAPDMGYYGGGDWSYLDGEFEIMEYTGLKDKNGREIYEGDLLKDDAGIGEVEWVQEHCAFMIFTREPSFYYHMESDGQLKVSEVIGNIYENPELLHET